MPDLRMLSSVHVCNTTYTFDNLKQCHVAEMFNTLGWGEQTLDQGPDSLYRRPIQILIHR